MYNKEKKLFYKPLNMEDLKLIFINFGFTYLKTTDVFSQQKCEKNGIENAYVSVRMKNCLNLYHLILNYKKLDEMKMVEKLINIFNKYVEVEHKDKILEVKNFYLDNKKTREVKDAYIINDKIPKKLGKSIYNLLLITRKRLNNLERIEMIKKDLIENSNEKQKSELQLETLI